MSVNLENNTGQELPSGVEELLDLALEEHDLEVSGPVKAIHVNNQGMVTVSLSVDGEVDFNELTTNPVGGKFLYEGEQGDVSINGLEGGDLTVEVWSGGWD